MIDNPWGGWVGGDWKYLPSSSRSGLRGAACLDFETGSRWMFSRALCDRWSDVCVCVLFFFLFSRDELVFEFDYVVGLEWDGGVRPRTDKHLKMWGKSQVGVLRKVVLHVCLPALHAYRLGEVARIDSCGLCRTTGSGNSEKGFFFSGYETIGMFGSDFSKLLLLLFSFIEFVNRGFETLVCSVCWCVGCFLQWVSIRKTCCEEKNLDGWFLNRQVKGEWEALTRCVFFVDM